MRASGLPTVFIPTKRICYPNPDDTNLFPYSISTTLDQRLVKSLRFKGIT